MSYETINTKQVYCPCGKGKIKYTLKENDWFQTKEYTEILCCECNEKYVVVSEFSFPKPKHDSKTYYCKNKNTGEKIKLDL